MWRQAGGYSWSLLRERHAIYMVLSTGICAGRGGHDGIRDRTGTACSVSHQRSSMTVVINNI